MGGIAHLYFALLRRPKDGRRFYVSVITEYSAPDS
jgi:hypothetical protein